MKNLVFLLFITINFIGRAQTVKIAAAADLRYAMDEIVAAYKTTKPSVEIDVVYGSSGNAFTQIKNGAPFDIYFSADIAYPQKLKDEGLTLSEPKLYGVGQLVLWSSTLDVSKGPAVLADLPTIKIAIANPHHAPYGQRSVESLKYYNLYNKLEKQLILAENISQAAQYCLTGNADAGFLALSLVLSPAFASKGNYFLIDSISHSPLQQGFVLLKHANGNTEALRFSEYISTNEVRKIFEKYGFKLPK